MKNNHNQTNSIDRSTQLEFETQESLQQLSPLEQSESDEQYWLTQLDPNTFTIAVDLVHLAAIFVSTITA